MTMLRMLIAFLCLAAAAPAMAHSQSYGYLAITPQDQSVTGSLDLAVRDLDLIYDLDANRDGEITWGEMRSREAELQAAVLDQISIGATEGACRLKPDPMMIDSRGGETYAVFPFGGSCPALGDKLMVSYHLMFAADAQHRGLVAVHGASGSQSLVMSPGVQSVSMSLDGGRAAGLGLFATYVAHGAHHIWIGYDHILFLITLLLGTSLQAGQASIRQSLSEAVKVISAFTLSHSLTLGLAATGVLRVPASIAESLIAVTIVASAINNVRPFLTRRVWLLALVFGLVHGLGFANVLAELGLPRQSLLPALLAFNIGVEIGQLAIAAVALPALLLLARRPAVSVPGLVAANCIIAAVGAAWFSDRVFATGLMPF